MSLSLKELFTADSDCLSFNTYDNSGIYSSSNTGGYNTPNPAIADASAATLTISILTDYATQTYSTAVVIDAYPTLPNITNTPFNVTGALMGNGDDSALTDGYYKIIYTVTTTGPVVNTVTKYVVLTCQIDSCYKALANQVALCSFNCVELEERLRRIAYFRRQLTGAVNCGNIGAIMKYLEYLTSLCDTNDCC